MVKLSTRAWIGIGVVAGVAGYFLWESKSSLAAPASKAPAKNGLALGGGTSAPPAPKTAPPPAKTTPPASAPPAGGDTGYKDVPAASSVDDVTPPPLTDADKNDAFQAGSTEGTNGADFDISNNASAFVNPTDNPIGTTSSGKSFLAYPELVTYWKSGYTTGYATEKAAKAAAGISSAATSGYGRFPRAGAFHPSMYGYPQGIFGRRSGWN
jgi:hypothetical protein